MAEQWTCQPRSAVAGMPTASSQTHQCGLGNAAARRPGLGAFIPGGSTGKPSLRLRPPDGSAPPPVVEEVLPMSPDHALPISMDHSLSGSPIWSRSNRLLSACFRHQRPTLRRIGTRRQSRGAPAWAPLGQLPCNQSPGAVRCGPRLTMPPARGLSALLQGHIDLRLSRPRTLPRRPR